MRLAYALLAFLSISSAAHALDVPLIAPGTVPRWTCAQAEAIQPDWRSAPSDDGFEDRRVVPDAGTGCAATQLFRWRFEVPAGTPRAGLTLRIRYQHGFAAYLNGIEVARRALPPDAALDTLASTVHGPEWELIPVPASALVSGRTNLLAIEAHPRTPGREPTVEVSLVASDGPRYTRGPYLLEVTKDRARIAFETDLPTSASVAFGAGGTSSEAVPLGASTQARRHVFELRGLRPATTYEYRTIARGADPQAAAADSGSVRFHTQPLDGRPLHFVIYGDVRSGHDVHAAVARSILAEEPDLAIMTGDLVDMGSDEADWDRYFEIATPLISRVPVYPSPGNHEYARAGKGAERYYALFRTPRPQDENPGYRSFDVAGVHFVALDSNQYRNAAQLGWLERDLQAARKRGARAIIAYAHEGAFSSGMHGDSEIAKAVYAPLLERYGVALFVGGHDHHYERGRVGKLEYIVSGGGGAELRTQRCGLPGKKACPPRVGVFINEHHYVVVDVLPGLLRLCPKRPDGSPLEPCYTRPLPPR